MKPIHLLVAGTMLLLSCSQPRPTPETQTVPAADGPTEEAANAKTLRLLYGRSPTTLNPHLANGFQDFEAARIIYEPLASYDAEGDMVAILAAEIPTVDNGGLAADGRSVTWKLRPDVVWSDGTAFTAADVAFTFEFV
ncbi:MAG: ABC transporter substrate-binding protein, partial [Cyanobacteria bacterium J06629_9]